MKKSLIALAALAAVGAASAQSSVTLYGIADISAGVVEREGYADVKDSAGNITSYGNQRSTGFNKANLQQSRVGIKGSEDLGNGLKAVFNYEHGFNSANGAFAGGEARRAVVGLQGGFGSVLLGRDKLPLYRLAEDTSADSISDFSTTNLQGAKRTNGVHYAGNFGGVGISAAAGYDREDYPTADGNDQQKTTYGLGLSYATGPFMVGIAGEQDQVEKTPANGVKTKDVTSYGIGGTYDFTAAKVFANYMVSDNDLKNSKDKEANLGVKVPFGAASLVAEVGYNDGDNYDGIDYNVGANYGFSKRTDAYVRAARVNSFDYDAGNDAETTKYAVGLRHKF